MIRPERPRSTEALTVAAAVGLLVTSCTVVSWIAGDAARLLVDVALSAVIAAWIALLGRSLWEGRRLGETLASRSVATNLNGIRCRVVVGSERRAFVLGAIRPTIYVGETLMRSLDQDELQAVLLHEEFHRRTLGPLRAASIGAWLRLARPLTLVSPLLADRLVDLERAADRHALRHGATAAGMASALVKVEAVEGGVLVAFSSAADRRVGGLLEFTSGLTQTPDRLPYEWLPAAAALSAVTICHLLGALLLVV